MPALRIVWIEFALCIFFAAYSGSRIYEIICSRTADNYKESVALQYIGEKVRQGDEAGNIRVVEINQISVLELGKPSKEDGYILWIYAYEGRIRELFAAANTDLELEDGICVLECDGLWFHLEDSLLTVEIGSQGGKGLFLAVRSREK